MNKLTLETFMKAADDRELCEYIVLGALQKHTTDLHMNRLYPVLTELIELGETLKGIIDSKSRLEGLFPDKAMKIETGDGVAIIDNSQVLENDINKIFDFINWAYPKILEAIGEGKAIYRFVKENIDISEVGITPLYKNDGYFLIPDNKTGMMMIYKFLMPIISTNKHSRISMDIELVDSISKDTAMEKCLSEIKLDLIKKFPGIPNPATFRFDTELDFPFIETILPVAKRKLVTTLAA